MSSTRGRVVQHLRRGPASVSDLANVLGLTDNAIRSHLATLERDRLVRTAGKRPGVRRPEVLYELTPEATQLFPHAYHLLFNRLLDVLSQDLTAEQIDRALEEVGASLAAEQQVDRGLPIEQRARQALELLEDLGGLAELHVEQDHLLIQGHSCPLASAVQAHPTVCRLAESMLAELLDAPVQEVCIRNGAPRCAFKIEK